MLFLWGRCFFSAFPFFIKTVECMILQLGKTKYNIKSNDHRDALDIISEFCKEKQYHYTAPLIIDSKTQHVTIMNKCGQPVLESTIHYDKR